MTDFYGVYHEDRPTENGINVTDDDTREYCCLANTGLWHLGPTSGAIVLFADEHHDRVPLFAEEVYEYLS